MSSSKLVNKPVKESGFRQLYNVNILGIQRQAKYILQDIKDVKMQAGDVLLVQGKWSDIDKLNLESSEWVVVGQPMERAAKVPLSDKAPVAAPSSCCSWWWPWCSTCFRRCCAPSLRPYS